MVSPQEMRREQADIRSGFREMGEAFIQFGEIRKLAGMFAAGDQKVALVMGLAFAQNHQPDIVSKQAVQNRQQQINPFLFGKPADQNKHRSRRVRLEARLF